MSGNLTRLPKLALLICILLFSHTFPVSDAFAGWREKLGVFRVGMVDGGRPVLEARRARPFQEALAKKLSLPVEIFTVPDHQALIEAHLGSRIEYAIYSASAFSAAWVLCKCVEPLAAPRAADGSIAFQSVLLTNDKKANGIDRLRGQKIFIPGRDSFAGFGLPNYQLGLLGQRLEEGDWELVDAGSMEAAIEAYRKENKAGIFGWIPVLSESFISLGKDPTKRGTAARLSADKPKSRIIWRSPAIPHGPHAVRTNLDPEARALLWEFLDELDEVTPGAYAAIAPNLTGGFAQIGREDYQAVINMVRAMIVNSGTQLPGIGPGLGEEPTGIDPLETQSTDQKKSP